MTQAQAAPSFSSLTNTATRIKIVDVGANPVDGTPPYAPLMAAGNAEVIGFEPNPDALARLHAIKGPHETYLPYVIGDGQRHILKICSAEGMTSLLEPNPNVLDRFHGFPRWRQVIGRLPVNTVRLDDIEQTRGLDLLKIDIQGGELMVFQNAIERLQDALVIQTEVEFLQMYVDQPLFGDVDVFLRQHGFVFHRFEAMKSRTIAPMLVNGDIYAGLSQTVWADALFVRDFTRLALLSDRQVLAMAMIMHDCYQSYDLTLHLLTALDARTNANLATAYLTGLQSGGLSAAA
jgi:FkbM family methyltransferase